MVPPSASSAHRRTTSGHSESQGRRQRPTADRIRSRQTRQHSCWLRNHRHGPAPPGPGWTGAEGSIAIVFKSPVSNKAGESALGAVVQSAIHSFTFPTMSNAPQAETQPGAAPVFSGLPLLTLHGPPSGVLAAAACQSWLANNHLPDSRHACWA